MAKVTERTIQAALMWWTMEEKHHQFAIPNSGPHTFFGWESDLLSMTRAGLFHEFEIKLSQGDYRRDFDKRYRHQELARTWNDYRWRPCYFWYVVHGFDPDPPPPDYAGLIVYDPSGFPSSKLRIERDAPRLSGRRLENGDFETASRILSYRLKNAYQNGL